MFDVVCKGGFDGRNPIASGISFGVLGEGICFAVSAKGIGVPLTIKFNLLEDPSKPPAFFLVNPNLEQNLINLEFYNAPSEGSGTLNQPVSVLSYEGVDFQFICHIDRIAGTKTYRLAYEFFEQVVAGGAR